ncbi:hypothetical protein [Suttonella ornithocola]|uniref:Uncharacterized protein n=1 Tax=Suttonella ornithocola TaxID=279832 RepID=A0A380N0B5_9GAMM|nr:hypothetical protein [Suttonella ornithocola]SUO97706.1 Uncharacterised protein [Suttonella ornithocola]
MTKKAVWDIDTVLNRHGLLLLKLWLQAAKQTGLSKEESRAVLQEATKGGYLHLVETLKNHSISTHQSSNKTS